MNETAAFMVKFLQADFNNVPKLTKHNDNTLDVFSRKISRKSYNIDRETIRSRIQIPSEYYIKRGFDPSTLDEFDIGECIVKKQPMSGRVVVPVYDEENNYVGCVGRSLTDNMQPKWLHSKGFTKNVLYGMNIAKQHILSTGTAILVEGQGDVWKMHQAGLKMTVGIFGSSLNEDQLILLEMSGALNIVILTDSDDAGANAYKQIMKKCGRRFNYVRPTISKKDVGEMSVEEIKDELYPQLKGIINEH
jgi:DNA primase